MIFEEKVTFLVKSACGFFELTLEPPLPDERRRWNGAPDGADGSGDAEVSEGKAGEILRFMKRVAPKRCGASGRFCLWVLWIRRYLKIEDTEEICGRFGSFDEQTTAHISTT